MSNPVKDECNFIEVFQERTESRTAYFRVPKDITEDDVQNYLLESNRSSVNGDDLFFPEWDNPYEGWYVIRKCDQDEGFCSFLNDTHTNDDKTKLIISNRYTAGVLFRDLTSCKRCGADNKHRKIIH